MRGTGGKWVGEQLLNHLYYHQESAFVIEGSSLRSARATRDAYACARLGSCLHLTILRHPVDRVISRYFFEGRWGLFKKPVKDEEISFSDWLREKRQIHAGHRNERLWSVTSELYTKTLAGVVVDKNLQLSFVHLETAKEWLDAGFPLITEWLSTPHAARALGRRLCFATDGSGKPPIHVPNSRKRFSSSGKNPPSVRAELNRGNWFYVTREPSYFFPVVLIAKNQRGIITNSHNIRFRRGGHTIHGYFMPNANPLLERRGCPNLDPVIKSRRSKHLPLSRDSNRYTRLANKFKLGF